MLACAQDPATGYGKERTGFRFRQRAVCVCRPDSIFAAAAHALPYTILCLRPGEDPVRPRLARVGDPGRRKLRAAHTSPHTDQGADPALRAARFAAQEGDAWQAERVACWRTIRAAPWARTGRRQKKAIAGGAPGRMDGAHRGPMSRHAPRTARVFESRKRSVSGAGKRPKLQRIERRLGC